MDRLRELERKHGLCSRQKFLDLVTFDFSRRYLVTSSNSVIFRSDNIKLARVFNTIPYGVEVIHICEEDGDPRKDRSYFTRTDNNTKVKEALEEAVLEGRKVYFGTSFVKESTTGDCTLVDFGEL